MRTGATFSPPAVMRISCAAPHTVEKCKKNKKKTQVLIINTKKDLCDVMDEVWKYIYIL